jgi:hypothetical protein
MPLALLTFGNVLHPAVFKDGFHPDFAAAGTEKFLGGA